VTQNQIMDLQTVNNLAKEYFDKKDFNSALKLLDRRDLPLELIPNLAKCYYYTNQADKALECVLPLEKSHNLWIDTAIYYNAIGDSDKAFEIYKSLDQNDSKVKFNISWHYLQKNEFSKGFENIQYGKDCRAWGHEYLYLEKNQLKSENRWDGNYTHHLLLILEGGLGDEIIFLRWAKWLETKCSKLTILCNPSLLRLFTNSGYNCEPHSALSTIDYTAYCPAMTLPAIAKIEHPTQYVELPYIQSFAETYIAKQIDKIARGKKKIGIRFYGNPEFEHDQFRSPPREELEKIAKFGQLFSLQINENDDTIPNCKHLIKDWQDTYSVFKALDVLITTCTSTAHLAGAMGIRVIVLVPLVPYFVWASDEMRWYKDNVTVIRQTKYNDWTEAIERLNDELSKFCSIES
jgi:tetratricopeptide (TPR) repeat protein